MPIKCLLIRFLYLSVISSLSTLLAITSYGQSATDVLQGQFVVGIDPADREKALIALQGFAAETGLIVSRKYPNHQAPKQAVNEYGQALADLSTIYEVKHHGDAQEQEALIKLTKRVVGVHWAEPLYKHELLYVPNDPLANPATTGQANYLNLIKAYDAWNVGRGDTSIKIGIVDSGLDVFQEDLRNKIAYNQADPINGLDDDGNGLVDDFFGWNFFDNNRNLGIAVNSNGHGQTVASIAAAEANNQRGLAGIAFNCRFVPVVVFGPGNASGDTYAGIVYAADRGCQVINLSWGRNRNNQSEYERMIIRYATINKNASVVAAAGNTNAELDFLPASYEFVTSVAYTDYSDNLDPNATVSTFVDMTAPGGNVWSINATGGYSNSASGSSFAAPMVAAGMALLKAQYPFYNAQQIAELCRVNADDNRFLNTNRGRFDRMGYGRLNLLNAIARTKSVAMRLSNIRISARNSGNLALANDTLEIRFDLTNYLNPVLNGRVEVAVTSGNATVTQGFWTFNALASMGSLTNDLAPLRLIVPSSAFNQIVRLQFRLTSTNYSDFQNFKFVANPDYADLGNDRISTTYASNGRISYADVLNTAGRSHRLDGKLTLGAGGLVLAVTDRQVPNNIIDTAGKDNHFAVRERLRWQTRNTSQDQWTSLFNDSLYGLTRPRIAIRQVITGLKTAPANRCQLLEYELFNQSNQTYDSVSLGVFTDWDLNNTRQNVAAYDTANKIGYVYAHPNTNTTVWGNRQFAGVQVIGGGEPQFFASDLDITVQGTNVNFNTGFSLANKFRCITRGLLRTEAGMTRSGGNDVATLTGIKIRNFRPGERRKVAFAIGSGYSLSDLRTTFSAAKLTYSQGKMGQIPQVSNVTVCAGSDVYIVPRNGVNFGFYDRAALTTPLATGRFLLLRDVRQTTTIYVTNQDSVYESAAVPVTITVTGPQANFRMTPSQLDLRFGNTVNFTNTSVGATSYQWSFGNGNTSSLTSLSQQYSQPGYYPVRLIARSNTSPCVDTLTLQLYVFDGTTNLAERKETALKCWPNPTKDFLNLDQVAAYAVYNLMGHCLASGRGTKIDLREYAKGLYLVQLNGAVVRVVRE